jgi:hypothetical protein
MSSNSSLEVLSEIERMTSIIIDTESQNKSKDESLSEIQVPLRGILKKPEENIIFDKKIQERITKLCFTLIVISIITPIAICDLYFGFTDSQCASERPDKSVLNLSLYLILAGFVSISCMITILIAICCIDFDDISDTGICLLCCGSCGVIGLGIFSILWNIFGAVLFWGYIYGNGKCNKTFSTYVFVSLIIKFISILFGWQLLNKKKNDKK